MAQPTSWADVTEATRRVMRGNRSKDTKPELTLRKALHGMGYRFRLHRRDLPGTPDVVLPRYRAAVQVHGCFWHQHPGCARANMPKSRQEYWCPKLARNVARDRDDERRLVEAGWRVLVVWECETGRLPELKERLDRFLRGA